MKNHTARVSEVYLMVNLQTATKVVQGNGVLLDVYESQQYKNTYTTSNDENKEPIPSSKPLR